MVRMTLDEIMAVTPSIDRAKLEATSEGDIRGYQIEDGHDPDAPIGEVRRSYPAAFVRRQLGLTQEAFAAALHIPLPTLRDWERGDAAPDPAEQALLRAVANDPRADLAAIAG